MKDIEHNFKIAEIRTYAAQTASATYEPTSSGINMQAEVTAHFGLHERVVRGMVLLEVGVVASGGTLDIIVQDSPDASTWDADFCTVDQIDAAGIYVVDLRYFQKYVRLSCTVGTNTVTWGAKFIGVDNQRAPVHQADATFLTVDYAANRVTGA